MKRSILIVDDEQDLLDLLVRSLEPDLDCRVATAPSGVEALRRLSEEAFDLVLADIKMPGMDGLELLEIIKRKDPEQTVVMMTAYGEVDTEESLALRRELGDRWGSASSQCELGYVATALGNLDEARDHLSQGVRAALEIGAIPLAMDGLLGIADLLQKSGQTQRTVELLSLLLHHPTTNKKARDKAEQLLEQSKGKLSAQALSEALDQGKGRELADMVEYVLSS